MIMTTRTERLSEKIIAQARARPEGVPVTAKGLLHLGSRAAVDQALSRLTKRGALLRAGRGALTSANPASAHIFPIVSAERVRPVRIASV
jgi:hypothetical protein